MVIIPYGMLVKLNQISFLSLKTLLIIKVLLLPKKTSSKKKLYATNFSSHFGFSIVVLLVFTTTLLCLLVNTRFVVSNVAFITITFLILMLILFVFPPSSPFVFLSLVSLWVVLNLNVFKFDYLNLFKVLNRVQICI